MPLTSVGSPLVGGMVSNAMQKTDTVFVRVLRAFFLAGEPQAVDKVLEVPRSLAIELAGGNKVVQTEAPKAKPAKAAKSSDEG